MSQNESNAAKIHRGFGILLKNLAPYVARELMAEFGPRWWQVAVLARLRPEQSRNLPPGGDDADLINSLDIFLVLLLLDLYWKEIFAGKMARDNLNWVMELKGARNRLAHIGSEDIGAEDAWRALDTMARLCEAVAPAKAAEIRALMRETLAVSPAAPGPKSGAERPRPSLSGLPGWREVIRPHPDVTAGRYKNAEFAADLAQVARGEGAPEYLDPNEFFARTYITDGMLGLLTEALRRVAGVGGEPVIQLKTAFGGGKTHSMLALYHLFGGAVSPEKTPALKPALVAAGLSEVPPVRVVALVGTALDPSKSKRPADLPGVRVSTLWGELAARLAVAAGKPDLYELVKEADKKGVSPGSETLTRLFDQAGSCLALMDELVTYGRKLYGKKDLPAGDFDNFITFIQELGEAARASKTSLVVASIPESELEIGGEGGHKTLAAIEHVFGRVDSVWKPVAANEGFEVVRRRLFLDCHDEAARDLICESFAALYRENPDDFPIETRELEYRRRLAACFPVHPEVFDRLYEDWATLEHFQRTRGVLRLMAAVVHELWMEGDSNPFILPGTLPLAAPAVRDELIRRLPETWNSIADREVDGKNSIPFRLEEANSRYAKYEACRRVARAIMLGSAPTSRKQRVRGLKDNRVRLAAACPGDQLAVFNDALAALQNSLSFLYSGQNGDRFWYDTRPTLRKTMEERAAQTPDTEVEFEIERRLKGGCKKAAPLAGVHVCPDSSLDVPDEQVARLVVLPPKAVCSGQAEGSPASLAAEEILERKGNSPRRHKNTLVFLAPDKTDLESLRQEVRRHLAWESIKRDREELNLDAAQNRETEDRIRRSSENVDNRLYDAWRWLLVPGQDRDDPKKIRWETSRLSGKEDAIVCRVAKKLAADDQVIEKWAPEPLQMDLDNLLWKDAKFLQVNTLWEYLTSYLYLPRLADYRVLEAAIQSGVESGKYFAYAAAIGENRYVDLKFQRPARIDKSGFLVKREEALAQIVAEERARRAEEQKRGEENGQGATASDSATGSASGTGSATEEVDDEVDRGREPKRARFFMSANLDATRINRDINRITEEILNWLSGEGTLEISLEVQARAANGFSPKTVGTVEENCRALKIGEFGFEEE